MALLADVAGSLQGAALAWLLAKPLGAWGEAGALWKRLRGVSLAP